MKKVCVNCHGSTHIKAQRDTLEITVELYNVYYKIEALSPVMSTGPL